MPAVTTLEIHCDVCRKPVVGGLRKWQRKLPGYDTVGVCASCSYRLTRTADGRGLESEDMMHLTSVYRTLAGEIWADAERVYWFKQPFVHRPDAKLADVLDREPNGVMKISDLTKKELVRARAKL